MTENLTKSVEKIISDTDILKTLNLEIIIADKIPDNAYMFPEQNLNFKELIIYCKDEDLNNHNGDKFYNIYKEIESIYPKLSELSLGIFVQFIFKNCTVDFHQKFVDLKNKFYIIFEESKISYYVYYANTVENLSITNGNFINCHFKQISIMTNVENIEIDLSNSKIDSFQLVSIDISDNKKNKIRITNSEITSFNIQNTTSNIDMFFSDIRTPKKEENNNVQLIVKNSTFNGRFILKDSCFKTKFDLESVTFNKDVSFKNLDILELELDSVFFNGSNSVDFSLFNIQNKDNMNRSTARRIKHLLEKDSNKIEANIFHAYELKARKRELNNPNNFQNNWLDKIVFFFNEKTSNFGLNWLLPLFWMVFVGLFYSSFFYTKSFTFFEIILFVIALVSAFYIFTNKHKNTLGKYTVSLLPGVIFYIIIVYKHDYFEIDSIFKFLNIVNFEKDNNISLFENTFSKAIMGYLIYQFINSVRKDTRK